MRVAVVTDSTCDLPSRLVEEMGVCVVPVLLHMGRETYHDGVDITREAFYELLPTLPDVPQTSAPAPGTFAQLYGTLLCEAEAIVSVHAASKLTGIYSAACVAATAVDEERISVIDSGQLSMGLGWAVLAAAEASRAGEDLQGVRTRIDKTLRQVRVFAIFDTMEYLRKGGRVSWIRVSAAGLLCLKPVVELREGEVFSRGRVRTWSKAVVRLAAQARQLGSLQHVAVMHSNCPECAEDFVGRIGDVLPTKLPLMVDVTPVISTHIGPHALGLAALVEDEPQD